MEDRMTDVVETNLSAAASSDSPLPMTPVSAEATPRIQVILEFLPEILESWYGLISQLHWELVSSNSNKETSCIKIDYSSINKTWT